MKSPFHHFNAIDAAIKGKITIYTVVSQWLKDNPRTERLVTRNRESAFKRARSHRNVGCYKVEIFAKAY